MPVGYVLKPEKVYFYLEVLLIRMGKSGLSLFRENHLFLFDGDQACDKISVFVFENDMGNIL